MKLRTIEFIKSEFEKAGYQLLTKKYINNHQKLWYICPRGHTHSMTWNKWQQGGRCAYCNGNAKLTIEFVRSEFKKEGYQLLTTEYKNSTQKLEYICPKGHKHTITWNWWNSGTRCAYCSMRPPININVVKDSFDKAGYVLLTNYYVNAHQQLEYICSEGHKHFMTWNNWNKGKRCQTCFYIKNTGINHPNWKGGLTPLYMTIRNNNNSTKWVQQIFERDNHTCQKCNKRGGNLNAHHLVPFSEIINYYNITTTEEAKNCALLFDTDNGITLCEDCHKWVHSNKNINKEFVRGLEKELTRCQTVDGCQT